MGYFDDAIEGARQKNQESKELKYEYERLKNTLIDEIALYIEKGFYEFPKACKVAGTSFKKTGGMFSHKIWIFNEMRVEYGVDMFCNLWSRYLIGGYSMRVDKKKCFKNIALEFYSMEFGNLSIQKQIDKMKAKDIDWELRVKQEYEAWLER